VTGLLISNRGAILGDVTWVYEESPHGVSGGAHIFGVVNNLADRRLP
jgi:hypothetical protein